MGLAPYFAILTAFFLAFGSVFALLFCVAYLGDFARGDFARFCDVGRRNGQRERLTKGAEVKGASLCILLCLFYLPII